ncbi:hypothetical protein STRTUCAR8_07342, partial [Streptomyces turgidiscabies Car8]
ARQPRARRAQYGRPGRRGARMTDPACRSGPTRTTGTRARVSA